MPITCQLANGEEAQTAVSNEQTFNDVKEKMIKGIDARIANLSEAKACIQGAANKDALKSCREKMREANQELKKEAQKNRPGKKNKK